MRYLLRGRDSRKSTRRARRRVRASRWPRFRSPVRTGNCRPSTSRSTRRAGSTAPSPCWRCSLAALSRPTRTSCSAVTGARSVHSGADVRLRAGAVGRPRRRGFAGASAAGVLRPAARSRDLSRSAPRKEALHETGHTVRPGALRRTGAAPCRSPPASGRSIGRQARILRTPARRACGRDEPKEQSI